MEHYKVAYVSAKAFARDIAIVLYFEPRLSCRICHDIRQNIMQLWYFT